MSDWLAILRDGAATLGLTLTLDQEARFARYLEILCQRNTQVNLTAITDPGEIAAKHFLDAMTVETIWQPAPGSRAIDIGTGAGVPGIPMAIRHPQVAFVLNDSTRKKVDFLAEVAAELPLPNVQPLWARAEALGRDAAYRGQFQTAFARAVAHLGQLIEYALPLLVTNGLLIAMKGPSGEEEIAQSQPALQALGGTIAQVSRFTVAGAGERLLIAVRATAPAPARYPRDGSAMKKRPLYLDRPQRTS